MSASRQAVVLLSVRSPHAERLLTGDKTVEFRRRPWRVQDRTPALLYRSRDVRAIVGSVVIESTVMGAPAAMWSSHGHRSGLSRREFREYFEGASVAVAISVSEPRSLTEPLTLEELRRRSPTFHVPQSYRFMQAAEISTVLNGERAELF